MSESVTLENGMRVEEAKVWTTMVEFDQDGDEKFVSVTDWINGEGFDVEIDDKPMMSLEYKEAEALMHALKASLERGA